ncbi:MAG: hypothetical protein IKV41_00005 [Oscillospiraceae bacterium]|nr:hypothetical protein [Oscillospiraceae bacterium]
MNRIRTNYPSPAAYNKEYNKFKGVDMSADPALIDESRSPWAPNLISDTGGNPEKRMGWRVLAAVDKPVNGIFRTVLGGNEDYLVHGGTKLYKWDGTGEAVLLKSGIANSKSAAVTMAGKCWILTGSEYLCYDGKEVKNAAEAAYVPLVIIARKPAGGGTVYEDVNLICGKQKNSFLSDGQSKEYKLTAEEIAAVNEVTVNDEAVTAYTVDKEKGIVTFTTAPAVSKVTGQDNVIITFTKDYEGYTQRITKCRTMVQFGDRLFVTGNPDSVNMDWHSGLDDPSYFPDLGYSQVGSEESAIMGYRRLGEHLAVIKEDNNQDSTVFLRRYDTSSDGTAIFAVTPGAVGVGAVSRYAFANLMDEPLFLARTGVYAITSNAITAERTIKNRSFFVNAALTKEENLAEAAACEWNGYYILAVNGRCYILDGKQAKSGKGQYSGDFSYECYHWDNIPARVMLEHEGALFFGTADGRLCRFNTDIPDRTKYNDNGEPITAWWSTKADDDGNFMQYKTMTKRGSGVMLKPYVRSGVHVLLRGDGDTIGHEIGYTPVDIFDWEDIDFSRFTFDSNDAPRVIPFNKKKKKYLTLQITVKNDALNEGFGVYGIIKRYVTGGYRK